jgi:hypothetical protein
MAGVFEAWPRFRRWPKLAPPFLSGRGRQIAVSVGEPLDGANLAQLPRDEMMAVLQSALQKVVNRAEDMKADR